MRDCKFLAKLWRCTENDVERVLIHLACRKMLDQCEVGSAAREYKVNITEKEIREKLITRKIIKDRPELSIATI